MKIEKVIARIEEEFKIVHNLGLQGKSFDLKSAMLNVKPLVTEIEELLAEVENFDDELRIQEERRDL